jgi:cell division protein FtsN
VVSTPDQDEAQRVAVKVRAAGFPAAVVADKGLFKVRLSPPGAREAVDAIAAKLKARGFKPFAIKVE